MKLKKTLCLGVFLLLFTSSTIYPLSIVKNNSTYKKTKSFCKKHKKKVLSAASILIPAFLYVLYKCFTAEPKDDSHIPLKENKEGEKLIITNLKLSKEQQEKQKEHKAFMKKVHEHSVKKTEDPLFNNEFTLQKEDVFTKDKKRQLNLD